MSKFVAFRIDEALLEQARRAAQQADRTISGELRMALRAWLEGRKEEVQREERRKDAATTAA